ncbi:MAG: crotonase/enoyl-CoA hydratase family protein [Mycobacteriales bacterium]
MTDYSEIGYDVADGILTITLSRPDALNAFTPGMMNELLSAFDAADADDAVRVVIVTGEGRAFCAGADLSSGGKAFDAKHRGQTSDEPSRDGGGRVSLRIFESKKPVIGAINGPAVGVGLTMTLPMDVRLASDTSKFGFVFTRRGIVPEAASTWFLPRLVGPAQAAEWFLTGRVFGPDEALAGRLVSSIHPAADLMPAARALATEMTQAPSAISVALARQMMWRGLTFATPYRSHLADSRGMRATGASQDAFEGVSSFLEKRTPSFPDRVSADLPDIFSDPQPSWAADLPL